MKIVLIILCYCKNYTGEERADKAGVGRTQRIAEKRWKKIVCGQHGTKRLA